MVFDFNLLLFGKNFKKRTAYENRVGVAKRDKLLDSKVNGRDLK